MEVYRIVQERYADGLYASGRAARWNQPNQYVLYASASRALASLELIVNQARVGNDVPYRVLVIVIPANYPTISEDVLPDDWRKLSAYPTLQALGSLWYQARESLVLSVPSAVIPKEHNFLINTQHPDFRNLVSLKANEPYFWDERVGDIR